MSPKNPKMTDLEKSELVTLLKTASQIEHALLNAYLNAACSMKSTPQEFKEIRNSNGDLVENKRRAIHFEKAREWKSCIINICHEEMIHLHYVNCLLRALGETPYFGLPAKDKNDKDAWFIPDWSIKGQDETPKNGVKIPVKPFSLDMVKLFVAYESTDVLQNQNIFNETNMAVFKEMHDFELDLHVEMTLVRISDCKGHKDDVRGEIKKNYQELAPLDNFITRNSKNETNKTKNEPFIFQSIKDLYDRVSVLYKKADESGLIRKDLIRKDLNNEFEANSEGSLPIGPIFRTSRFATFHDNNNREKMEMNFKDAQRIIKEIVSEGEGMSSDLISGFRNLKTDIEVKGGTEHYAKLIKQANEMPSDPLPDWFTKGELIRQSHLYRFIQIFMDIKHEKEKYDNFNPSREIVDQTDKVKDLCEQMLSYFNANFLAMLSWLSRIYQLNLTDPDKPKRGAIEQLVTWPLMSLVMRPFLEIMSFFLDDSSNLFNVHYISDKYTLNDTKNLIGLTNDLQQSQVKNDEIDKCIFIILDRTSEWSDSVVNFVKNELKIDDFRKQMIIKRLKSFKNLREFRKQFSFRETGGFSDQLPSENSTYPKNDKFDLMYSENPKRISIEYDRPLYTKGQLLLKLSFCGFSKMQFASDPEPPTDEVGSTGTTMFHAADGDKTLTRTVLWLPNTNENIFRECCDDVPLGVNVYNISLNKVNTETLNFDELDGDIESNLDLVALSSIKPKKIFLNLENDAKGHQPFYLGDNHLVWASGEPVDPFILSINHAGETDETVKIAERSVHCDGKTLRQMEPIQRASTSRGPNFRDSSALNRRFCATALKYMPPTFAQLFKDPSRIDINVLFSIRSTNIYNKLVEVIQNTKKEKDQKYIDQVVSFSERLFLVPYGAALRTSKVNLPYWHTISGKINYEQKKNIIFDDFAAKGYLLDWIPSDSKRDESNSRWYIAYKMAFADFDALSNLCYGNLYIPVKIAEKSNS